MRGKGVTWVGGGVSQVGGGKRRGGSQVEKEGRWRGGKRKADGVMDCLENRKRHFFSLHKFVRK